jgi:hypothetical protein
MFAGEGGTLKDKWHPRLGLNSIPQAYKWIPQHSFSSFGRTHH